MRLHVDGAVRTGRAVDCTDLDVSPSAVLAAVRGSDKSVTVCSADPGPVHEHVGLVGPETTLRVRTALAAVAREQGLTAPQDEELADVQAELAAMDPPAPGVAAARERFAAVDEAELATLREDVAASRGAVQARLELDEGVEPARESLSEAAAELAEAQTDRVAAEQTLRRAREQAREARAARRERLRLQDRAGNLERAARAHLAGVLRDEFAVAVEAVTGEGGVPGAATSPSSSMPPPSSTPPASPAAESPAAPSGPSQSTAQTRSTTESPSTRPPTFEGDEATAALAIARMAELRAPVVLSGRWFESVRAAANRLCAPVIRV